jgi:hypothetical protein
MKIANLYLSVLMGTGALISFGSIASAGEGGSAGAISVIKSNGVVTSLSAASAVGKLNAAAATNTNATQTFANAFGSSGVINLTNSGNTNVNYQGAVETDLSLTISQANQLNPHAATIDATTGTVVIP